MARNTKNGLKPSNGGKKAKLASVPEKKVESVVISPKMTKLQAEMKIRVEKLSNLVTASCMTPDSGNVFPTLSDCEKILSAAFDCRNTARKLSKSDSDLIIA